MYAQTSNSATQIEVKSWEDTKDENNTPILAYNNMLNDDNILLDVGSYTFTLIVYNSDNKKVLEGSEEFTINPNQNNKLEFN